MKLFVHLVSSPSQQVKRAFILQHHVERDLPLSICGYISLLLLRYFLFLPHPVLYIFSFTTSPLHPSLLMFSLTSSPLHPLLYILSFTSSPLHPSLLSLLPHILSVIYKDHNLQQRQIQTHGMMSDHSAERGFSCHSRIEA